MSDQPTSDAAGAAKKKSALPLIVGGLVVLLAAAGGGAWWFLRGTPAEAKEARAGHGDEGDEGAGHDGEDESHGDASEPQGVVALEPFVVNLADQDATRFLRLTLKLLIPEEHAVEVEENEVAKARVRSAVLEFLAEQTADALVTPDGKAALKKAIATRARKAMAIKGMHITDVLFSEFVVQF
ncbi:MAG: flagellar basal body-associated protein FliL [Vicinamibacterales bacterium]